MKKWMLVLLAGCAHQPTVQSERVVQLPPEARQEIVQAQQGVNAADLNVTSAKVALDEAKSFVGVSDRELDAAKAHSDAAQRGLDLGWRSGDEQNVRAARGRREQAMRELFAARAKKDYAERLVDLRRAELSLRRAEQDQARADVEYVKYSQLRAHGMSRGMQESAFREARERAQAEVADRRKNVAELRTSTENLHNVWRERYQTASREQEIMPPPARQPVPVQQP